MNGTIKRDIFGTKTDGSSAVTDTSDTVTAEKAHSSYGVRIFIFAALSAVCAALSVYLPIIPDGLYNTLIASARSYASDFTFDRTLFGLAESVSSLSSDELFLTLFFAVCPVIIFRRQLIYASVLLRTYFLAFALGLVLAADVGTYPAVAVTLSCAASLSMLIYISYSALCFGDLIHSPDGCKVTSAAAKFTLKILSALGCYIITEILILLPSAFI